LTPLLYSYLILIPHSNSLPSTLFSKLLLAFHLHVFFLIILTKVRGHYYCLGGRQLLYYLVFRKPQISFSLDSLGFPLSFILYILQVEWEVDGIGYLLSVIRILNQHEIQRSD
jgi:hypothetical protein